MKQSPQPWALAAAKRGVARLDKHFGHKSWRRKIKRRLLDIHSLHNCPLGQLFGYYFDGTRILGLGGGCGESEVRRRAHLGFSTNLSEGSPHQRCNELTKAWKVALR